MRFETWNVGRLCRSCSLKTVADDGANYKLDLVGVQVRWYKGSCEPADDIIHFYMEMGMLPTTYGQDFFVHRGIKSAGKRVEFGSDRMSYIILRDQWCDSIFLNVHAPTEDKSDDTKDSFYGYQLENLGANGKIILKWILKRV
jgi:hypothetical protein